MTRTQKINKLANAIKAYRGSYDVYSKKWINPPQPARRFDIVRWLKRLGRSLSQIEQDAKVIDAFKTRLEFHEWINAI